MQTRSRKPESVSRGGFTLIEVMAVIAIIGMVFTIGLPRLSTSKLRALRTEAEGIAASLEFARQRAIMTSVPHRVLIDLEEGGYRVEWLVPEDRAFAAIRDTGGDPEDDGLAGAGLAGSDRAPIDLHPPTHPERDFYPVASRQLGSFTWLDDARYFVGLDGPSGWIEGGDVGIVFDSDGTTESARLEIADSDDNHLTLEIEPLLDRVRRREGGARS